MAKQTRLQQLFDKFLQRECTSEEVEELVNLLGSEDADENLNPKMKELWEQIKKDEATYPVNWEEMYDEVTAHEVLAVKKKSTFKRTFWRIAAAVAVLAVLSVSIYFSSRGTIGGDTYKKVATQLPHDVRPGGNKAVLTLSNGATIVLDQTNKGTLTKQGNMQIIKLDSGKLAYRATGNNTKRTAVTYNSLTTPRGGQYQLKLPDGTMVWLNAASSIRYPTAFTGMTKRKVEITGEVYFEVAQNKDKPFIVVTNNMHIQVLGTHFNVNAYPNEPAIKTTLLQGKIKVNSGINAANAIILTPGQQAQLNREGGLELIKNTDIDETVAWKNGLFVFHDDNLPAIMRKLARWYDVQIEYEGGIVPSSHFTGAIQRKVRMSKVLKMLELTGGAHFKIEGRKIIISS